MFVVSSRKFFTAWISLLSIVGYGFFVFAAAPTGGYVPGQTNNPACAPGDVDCFVQPGWLLTGNAGTNATNNFIGTTDAQDFVIRTDNEQVAKFGIGTGGFALGREYQVDEIFPGTVYVPAALASDTGAVAVGSGSEATNVGAFAFGIANPFTGTLNSASGLASFAIGISNNVSATNNFAIGEDNIVGGTDGDSYAFGELNSVTSAQGDAYAFGVVNNVSGEGAFAIGRENIASAQFSMALGFFSTASGVGSFTLGNGAVASGMGSTAFQAGIASGDYSISGGIMGTEASGVGSMAFGQANTASGAGSVVLNGDASTASGPQAFAMQQANTASGKNATAFGSSNTSVGENSVTFGLGNIAESLTEISLGSYGTDYVPANAAHDEWDTSDRLFTIGNGENDGVRSDAFTILKNGKTGIGYDNFETTNSNALLQVNGGILSATLSSCGLLETDSNGLFECGTLIPPAITLGTNATTIYSSGLSGTNQGDPSLGNNIILGVNAGPSIGASYGNYIGTSAGNGAFGGSYSNFIGKSAGEGATFAANSNFIGNSAGLNAGNAYYSSFIGTNAGSGATNASNSVFIGYNAGLNDTVNNSSLTPSSILIGMNTSTGGYSNSIAIGRQATNTAANQFMIGSTTSPIDTTRINGSTSTQCTITTGTGIACTSDERVKTNIVDLDNSVLDDLLNVRTVTYNWLGNPTGDQQIGFLAQNLEQYFPQLVATDSEGMKSVYYAQMTPILVEAIRELDLKITNIETFATSMNTTFIDGVRTWLGDVGNGIEKIFAREINTEKLCINQTCVTEDQLQQLLSSQNIQGVPSNSGPINDPEPESAPTSSDDGSTTDVVIEPVVVPEPEPAPGLELQIQELTPEPEPIPEL
jgi:hypothetical protein